MEYGVEFLDLSLPTAIGIQRRGALLFVPPLEGFREVCRWNMELNF
jgi:hypothetical protein